MFQEIPLTGEKAPETKLSLEQILKYRILPTDEVPKPDAVLFFNNQMVMSRQNISCVTGKAKVGKTFLMTLINEAILHKGEFQGVLSSYLPKGKDKIIYIDTEQSRYHISLILQRIKAVISNEKLENVLMFNFDALSTEKRRLATETLLYSMQDIGVCIIDGIADLVYDTNDIRESANMVDDLRKWATERDIHIINVLHQNPSQSEKMRGHLGTILTNKSETIIQISSSKEDESVKLVETLATRNKKPDNWSFEIIDGTPTIQNECYQEPKAGRKQIVSLKNYEKYGILLDVFIGIYKSNGIGYSVLSERIRELHVEKHGAIGISNVKELIKYCKEMNWIVQDGNRANYFIHEFKE
jgi:nucleoside-triphosphatase THEP1